MIRPEPAWTTGVGAYTGWGLPFAESASFSQRELARLTGRSWGGRETSRELRRAVLQLRTARIECQIRNKKTKQWAVADFNIAFCEFQKAIGFKNNTQDGIANMHKCLSLHYLGLQNVTQEEVEKCATWLEIATKGALLRGWNLIEPDLSGPMEE